MDAQRLRERIAGFDRWHYRFEFDGGISTPIDGNVDMNRHEQRRRYFFDALLKVNDGSLAGLRVLDLGCNAGFWSLQAVEAGADFVCGVDGRRMHVEQAELVFEAKGIDPGRFRFEEANIFTHDFRERFDVVLCLGLMYHIAKPLELFEIFDRTGAELVVIDTAVSFAPGSHFEVNRDAREDPRNAVDYEIVLVPTRGALSDLAAEFGYTTVALAHNMSDYTGMRDYLIRRRLAFVCARTRSLDALAAEQPPPVEPWWNVLRNPARRGWQRAPR
ncbi:MAG: class I SAM-dependent methyltransferase [Solirubrobacteraceae bacterium]